MLGLTFASVLQIVIFLLAFACRAVFAGSEIAFLSVNKLSVKNLVHQGRKDAMLVDELVSDMQRLIGVILIGTNLTGALATVMAITLTVDLGLFGANGVAVTTILLIFVVLIFGEILPKHYFSKHADVMSYRLAKPIVMVSKLFGPFAELFSKLAQLLSGRELQKTAATELTEESIMTMVTMGEEEGSVEESERDMIHGVFESGKTLAREVMVPRVDMVAADIEDGLMTVADLIEESGYSRIPVYEDTIDNIIGIVYAKDLLQCLSEEDKEECSISTLMRPAHFVPETKKASDLLRELRERRVHMAIILDEYGGVEGLATIEDLLEEIVGEIHDEYDEEEEDEIVHLSEAEVTVDARLTIDEANEALNLNLPDEEVETVGGFVYGLFDRVPIEGESITYEPDNVELKVIEVEGRRISRVKVTKLE